MKREAERTARTASVNAQLFTIHLALFCQMGGSIAAVIHINNPPVILQPLPAIDKIWLTNLLCSNSDMLTMAGQSCLPVLPPIACATSFKERHRNRFSLL